MIMAVQWVVILIVVPMVVGAMASCGRHGSGVATLPTNEGDEGFSPWAVGIRGEIPAVMDAIPLHEGSPAEEWIDVWNGSSIAYKAHILLLAKIIKPELYGNLRSRFVSEGDGGKCVVVRYGCFSRRWTVLAVAHAIDSLRYDWNGTPYGWPDMAAQNPNEIWSGAQ